MNFLKYYGNETKSFLHVAINGCYKEKETYANEEK